MFLVRKSPIVMGSHDRGFFCLERAAGRRPRRAAGRWSSVEDRVVRDIVELSTMSVEGRKSRVGSGGAGEGDI